MGNKKIGDAVAFLHPFWFEFERRRYEEGTVPSHRLWGQIELESLGRKTLLCPQAPAFFQFVGSLGWRLWQALWVWRNRERLSACVAVHEISGLGSLILKRLGLMSVPIILINFGLTHTRQVHGLKRLIWKSPTQLTRSRRRSRTGWACPPTSKASFFKATCCRTAKLWPSVVSAEAKNVLCV